MGFGTRHGECESILPLLCTALIVRALDTGSAIGARDDAHSILGLGMSAPTGLRGLYAALIRLRDCGITGMRVVGSLRAVAVPYCCHSRSVQKFERSDRTMRKPAAR